MDMPVLVTGAGGFIGSHVLARLRADPAFHAVAATRDGRGGTRALDLRNPAALPAAVAGMGAVVHCAVGDRAVTADGTAALLDAAARAGVRRFVHLSSVAVYGAAEGCVREDAPLVAPSGQGYPAWKAAAELACLRQRGLEVVRLRPAIVYGAGSALWVLKLAQRIRSGRWGRFGAAADGTCNLVHVRDVAAATVAALRAEGAGGGAFNVNGPEAMTWNDWFSAVAGAMGGTTLREVSPLTMRLRGVAGLPLKAVARVVPGFAGPWLLGSPARSERALFRRRVSYPVVAAAAVLQWRPLVGVEEGLAECAAAFRSGVAGAR